MSLSKLIRRTLAAILFSLSTILSLYSINFLDTNESFFRITYTDDWGIYVTALYLIFIIFLIILSIFWSQTNQILVQSTKGDERIEQIRQQTIQGILFPLVVLTSGWLLLHFAISNTGFFNIFLNLFPVFNTWTFFGSYFVVVPVITFPFVYGLWIDKEKELLNPYFTISHFFKNSSKLIAALLVFLIGFSSVAYSFLSNPVYVPTYYFDKSELSLMGDSNFEIVLNSPQGTIDASGNITNLSKLNISSFGEVNRTGNTINFYSLTDPYTMSNSNDDTGREGSVHVFSGRKLAPTDYIFGIPTIYINIKELKKLTITNNKLTDIKTFDGKCLANSELEIIIQGLDNGKTTLPCIEKSFNLKLNNPLNQPVEYKQPIN
jgi:hypothetical protein